MTRTHRNGPVQFAVDVDEIRQQARAASELAAVCGLSSFKGCAQGRAAPLTDLVREVFGDEPVEQWVHVPPSVPHTVRP